MRESQQSFGEMSEDRNSRPTFEKVVNSMVIVDYVSGANKDKEIPDQPAENPSQPKKPD